MKRSPEMFRALITLLDANPNYLEASRALRVSERLPFIWLQASKAAAAAGETESEFLFKLDPDDADEAPRWLHEHARDAISISIEQIEAAARHRARDGVWSRAKWQGRDVYKLCDPALADLLGDEYERDAKGNRIPEMIWTPPATDLVLGVLAAHARRYKKLAGGTTVNVNANAQSNGVLVIGKPKPAAPLPILEVVQPVDDAEAIAEMLGEDLPDVPDDEPELSPAGVAVVDRTAIAAQKFIPPGFRSEWDKLVAKGAIKPDETVIREASPPALGPAVDPLIRPHAALSEAERALLSRLPDKTNRKG